MYDQKKKINGKEERRGFFKGEKKRVKIGYFLGFLCLSLACMPSQPKFFEKENTTYINMHITNIYIIHMY